MNPDTHKDSGTILLLQPRLGYMDSMRSRPSLPLGLLHAASLAVQRYRVVIFDQRLCTDWRTRLAETIAREQPMLIGATMFLGPPVANALAMLEHAAGLSPAPRVAGGPLAGSIPELCLNDPRGRIQHVVDGEGEQALPALAGRVAAGEPAHDVPGVWALHHGDVRRGPEAPLLNLDTLPEIPYHLVDVAQYQPRYAGERTFYMETSRGCPMKCTYCYNARFNRGAWRAQSADTVARRIRHAAEQFGARSFYFVDDNFFIDKARGLAIAHTLAELGGEWQVQGVGVASLQRMADEDLALLRSSGLRRLTIGIESGSPRVRKVLGKSYSNRDVRELMARLHAHGFIVFCSFMCDIPTETRAEIGESANLALALIRDNPNFRTSPFYRYVPTPGTRLSDTAAAQGFRTPGTVDGWGEISFDHNDTSGADARFFRGLYVATLFCDSKSREYSGSLLFRAAAALYRPPARLRLRFLFFRYMPEARLFFWLLNRAGA